MTQNEIMKMHKKFPKEMRYFANMYFEHTVEVFQDKLQELTPSDFEGVLLQVREKMNGHTKKA